MKIFAPTADQCKLVTIYDSCIHAFRRHNSNSGVSWTSDPRQADLIVLFEEWGTRFWSYSETLAEDSFFRENWDRIFTVNCDDLGRGFLPGCYTSLNTANFIPRIHRACAYPYTYNEFVSPRGEKMNSEWLFSFRGTDVSHPVRTKLFRLFGSHPRAKMVRVGTQFHNHSAKEKQEYVDDILISKFVLCPRGWSPATYRLFEVMELGRCPVIISDDWIPIDQVPWQDCSIRIREKDIAYCADILTERECDAERVGRNAREVWELNFSEAPKFRAMLRSIRELGDLRGIDSLDYKERWSSWQFRHSNQWLLHQRLAKKFGRGITTLQKSVRYKAKVHQ